MPRIPKPLRPALVGLVLLGAPTAVAAGDPAPPTRPSQSVEAPVAGGPESRPAEAAGSAREPKLVCEQVQQMGSHFRKKVCATPEAWEARRRRDAAQMERMGDQGAGCGGVANPC